VLTLSGALQHVRYFDQGVKCFARHLTWDWQPFVFTAFKARFDGRCFTCYMYSFTFTCLACAYRLDVGGIFPHLSC